MMSLRDKDGPLYNNTKQETIGDNNSTKPRAVATATAAAAASSSRQWSTGFKNPRIVRVSRTFGGKDRHSKVCTIKGLRDRRIRLSVPTAIQLYDLQDRLGLNQPSKVIDWLIDNTKHDIEKLPPLPIIPGTFDPSQGYGVPLSSPSPFFDPPNFLSSRKGGININCTTQDSDVDEDDQSIVAKLKYWNSNNSNSMMRSKQKDHEQGSSSQVLAQNLFPIASSSTNNNNNSTFLSNNSMFNYYHLEPSNLSLTQLGSLGLPNSHDEHHNHHHGSSQTNSSAHPQSSSLSLSSVSQLFLCPSIPTSSYFNQNHHNSHGSNSFMSNSSHQVENDIRQLNRFPLSNNQFSSPSFHNNSSGLDMKPFPLTINHDPQGKSSHSLWKESSGNGDH